MGFPRYGVFVVCNSDCSHPVKGLSTVDDVVAAMNREASRSDDGLAVAVFRHARPSQSDAHARAARAVLEARQAAASGSARNATRRASAAIGSRRGLPCEGCGQPTHWIDFEIDGCSVCGHADIAAAQGRAHDSGEAFCTTCNPKKRTEP